MIRINEKKNDIGECIGFHLEGHANFERKGKDIVCAAVSALAINCMNSIEKFSEVNFNVASDEKKGILDFVLTDEVIPDDANLLLLSFFYGIRGIQKEYGKKYIEFINK